MEDILKDLQLGKTSAYPQSYDPSLLQSVPRQLNRASLNIDSEQPFYGYDVWHAYEISWLNDFALQNIQAIVVTLDVFQDEIS